MPRAPSSVPSSLTPCLWRCPRFLGKPAWEQQGQKSVPQGSSSTFCAPSISGKVRDLELGGQRTGLFLGAAHGVCPWFSKHRSKVRTVIKHLLWENIHKIHHFNHF